jgi:hypothetical protein
MKDPGLPVVRGFFLVLGCVTPTRPTSYTAGQSRMLPEAWLTPTLLFRTEMPPLPTPAGQELCEDPWGRGTGL